MTINNPTTDTKLSITKLADKLRTNCFPAHWVTMRNATRNGCAAELEAALSEYTWTKITDDPDTQPPLNVVLVMWMPEAKRQFILKATTPTNRFIKHMLICHQ